MARIYKVDWSDSSLSLLSLFTNDNFVLVLAKFYNPIKIEKSYKLS